MSSSLSVSLVLFFTDMVAQAYIKHIHSMDSYGRVKDATVIFGGSSQQDAREFFSFLIQIMHDETNAHRDQTPPKDQKEYTSQDGTVLRNAISFWAELSRYNASIVDKYWRGLEVFIDTCQSCHHVMHRFQAIDSLILSFPHDSYDSATVYSLQTLLQNTLKEERMEDLSCDKCSKKKRTRLHRLARLPDRLAISLSRFSSAAIKLNNKVTFDVTGLDLTEYMAQPDRANGQAVDGHFAGDMLYDLFAVTVHMGISVNSGHYYSYVKNDQSRDPTDWWKCNDSFVTPVKIGGQGNESSTQRMFKDGQSTAYMLFYRRRGT